MGMVKKGLPRRNVHINYALTRDEYNQVVMISKVYNLSKSEFLRRLVNEEYRKLFQDAVINLNLEGEPCAQNQ
jgi:hypothetical protein